MGKIEELIKRLCHNGVPYIRLQEIAEIGTGNSDRKDAVENGNYPFYVRSKDILRIDKYEYDETAIIIPGEGGIGEIFHYVEGKYALHQRAYRIHIMDNKLNTKYLYYYMSSMFKKFIMKKAVSATVTSIRKPMIEQFPVPVPPLEVQCEIVHILDDFTLLSAELSAELKARQQQYEYYKDKLFSSFIKNENIQWTTLGRYCKRLKGTAITAGKMKEIADDNGNIKIFAGGKTMINTDESNIPDKDIIKVPNIIVQSRGIIDFIYYDKPCSFKREMWSYTTENVITLKFIYYYLKNNIEFFRQRGKQMGSMPQISLDVTEKYKIPILPIEEQEMIVKILDKFEKLCNDISEGLPAEIDARKQQYEYYRDKLLTFKELKYE